MVQINKSENGLDSLDIAILTHLQEDGRKSFKDIAEEQGVSSSTITNRYNRLVNEGYLRIFAHIDPYRVGFKTPAFIGVKVQAGYLEKVASKLAELTEADYVAIVSGNYDVDVTLSCKDSEHLLDVIQRIQKIKGVVDTQSTIALKIVKFNQANVSLLTEFS